MLVLLGVGIAGCTQAPELDHGESGLLDVVPTKYAYYPNAAVAALEQHAADTGRRVLQELDGNAVDAFVATTLVQFVYAHGYTSLSGPLSATIYDAEAGGVYSIDGSFKVPGHSSYAAANSLDPAGKLAFIPGAPMALYRAHDALGSLDWDQVVEPARALAAHGFVPTPVHTATWEAEKGKLCGSAAYREAFYRVDEGSTARVPVDAAECRAAARAVRSPELVVQTALAQTLAAYIEHRADHFYCRPVGSGYECGGWAQAFLDTVNAHGGTVTPADLASYAARWVEPQWSIFADHAIASAGGYNFDTVAVQAAVRALELARTDPTLPTDLRSWGAPTQSVDTAELLVRLLRAVAWNQPARHPDTYAIDALGRQPQVRATIVTAAQEAWAMLRQQCQCLGEDPVPAGAGGAIGTHSSTNVVFDGASLVASTNTINSAAYGAGLEVGGVSINAAAASQAGFQVVALPGRHVPFPAAGHLMFRNVGGAYRPVLAIGTISAGIHAGNVQQILNTIAQDAWGLTDVALSHEPRIGMSALGITWVEQDFPLAHMHAVGARGLVMVHSSPVLELLGLGFDAGMEVMLRLDANAAGDAFAIVSNDWKAVNAGVAGY